jgi:hypothetical protein
VKIEYFIPADQFNHLPVGHFLAIDLHGRTRTGFNAGTAKSAILRIKAARTIDLGREAPLRAHINADSTVIALVLHQPEFHGTRLPFGG